MNLQQKRRPEPIIEDDEIANIEREIVDDKKDDEMRIHEQMNREERGCQPDQGVNPA